MIVYPTIWRSVGQEVTIDDLGMKITNILVKIVESGCRNLAFSGGLDSSLLLYYLCQFNNSIDVFTMGISDEHPDIIYSRKMAKYCRERFNVDITQYIYYPKDEEMKTPVYELFYNFVGRHTDRMIAGDGVDEFMCGYYAHMEDPSEETYYKYLRLLQDDHLIPLDQESGNVEVFLPYLDKEVVSLMTQIPLYKKVSKKNRKNFIMAMALASGSIPEEIISRRKYGLCDALNIKALELKER